MLKFSGSSCLIGGPNESWVCIHAPCKRSAQATGTCDAAGALTCRTWRVESRAAEASAPSTTLCGKGKRGLVHEVRCTRSSRSGTRRVRPYIPRPRGEEGGRASGVNRHSDKHAPRGIPEAQDAFKVLMIHWILQVARRIAFRCVLHRCGSQDIRR